MLRVTSTEIFASVFYKPRRKFAQEKKTETERTQRARKLKFRVSEGDIMREQCFDSVS